MVLSEVWTLAFGAQNSLPDQEDPDLAAQRRHHHHNNNSNNNSSSDEYDDDSDSHEERQEAAIAKILARQRVLVDAERDILGTTVYIPVPNVRDEAAENKSGFILVVTSLTLNNIGCYPFFGIRDRHQHDLPHLHHLLRSLSQQHHCTPSTSFSQDPPKTTHLPLYTNQQQQLQQNQQAVTDGSMTAVTATEISATIMAAMPSVSSSSPTTTTLAVNRARRGLRYLSAVSPRNPTLLQEFYPEMVCAMTSSMITRVLLYPLDTVASRVSAQGGFFPGIGMAPTRYNGFWDCWRKSLRPEGGGLWGLYSGVVDCIIVEAMVRWIVLEGTWFAHLAIKWFHRRS
ncbi:hypothetical protein BKA57DRAFT_434826 [Linnemannia elongata]|nr:hypothetical protein BKA57DRAFT_434826 [Linnemannia elongata]